MEKTLMVRVCDEYYTKKIFKENKKNIYDKEIMRAMQFEISKFFKEYDDFLKAFMKKENGFVEWYNCRGKRLAIFIFENDWNRIIKRLDGVSTFELKFKMITEN